MTYSKKVSLSEVNQSIDTPNNNRFWQNLKAFLGPGALVAVGYMDPGNWITSVVGGATYKYSLLSTAHHEARIQKNRGYCFNLDFDHLGYLCLSGSFV